MSDTYFEEKRERARAIFSAQKAIFCPYFQTDVILSSDGFHHLQFSARRERNKNEQLLKFTLLPLGLKIIKQTATLQEYRKLLCAVGKSSARDGSRKMKMVEWWGFIAIYIPQDIKVRVVLRRVGDGNITFWSVMPYSKIKSGTRTQSFFSIGIEDD